MTFFRHPNTHPDFIALTRALDQDLNARYGTAQKAYDSHNRIDPIPTAILFYKDGVPLACGCFKPLDEDSRPGVEIKRMYVDPALRGQGIGLSLLSALEAWAGELGYDTARLETGKGQPEAIGLYQKAGYQIIPNYGPYKDMPNSVCMEKELK